VNRVVGSTRPAGAGCGGAGGDRATAPLRGGYACGHGRAARFAHNAHYEDAGRNLY
jgi:hypothetical protein